MKKIALYDIDYTLISTNSLMDYIFYIIGKYPFKFIYFFYLGFMVILWALKIISTTRVKESLLILVKGFDKETIETLGKDFFTKHIISKIKKEAIENIEDYRKKGYTIIFSTASVGIYIKDIADYLKADYFFCTEAKFVNNKLVPKIEGLNCKGQNKITILHQEISPEEIDKAQSVSYSDSLSDLPFLDVTSVFYKVAPKKWKILKEIR